MGFELVILVCASVLYVVAGIAWLIDLADGRPEKYADFGSPVKGHSVMKNQQNTGSHFSTGGGINTVEVNGEYVHITALDPVRLCAEWSERQRVINTLYEFNRRANQGWRGVILRLLGIKLPERHAVIFGLAIPAYSSNDAAGEPIDVTGNVKIIRT